MLKSSTQQIAVMNTTIALKNDLLSIASELPTIMKLRLNRIIRSESRLTELQFHNQLEKLESEIEQYFEQKENKNKQDNEDNEDESKESEEERLRREEEREKFERERRCIQNLLKENIEFFREEHNPTIFQDLDNPLKATKLISGHVQSGKSAVICGIAIYMVRVLKKSVVIVLRNYTADYLQLSRKFQDGGEFSGFKVPVHYAKDCRETQIFSETVPAVTICIEHQTQLKKIADVISDYPRVRFCLIADEADAVCYKKDTNKERITQFNKIKAASSQFVAVTATAFDMLYMEHTLRNNCIYHVPITAETRYKGIDHPDFSIHELGKTFDFKLKRVTASRWRLSSQMEEFYTNLLDTEEYENAIIDEKEFVESHPVICLQKTEPTIKKQQQSLSALANHSVFGKEFTVLVYNGEGVLVYSPEELPHRVGRVCGKSFSNHFIPQQLKAMNYMGISIGDILQELKDQGIHTHIVIVAGHMVGRGLNITSNDYKWHLTHQILRMSESATCSDLVQSCRLFGKHRDSVPTQIYCIQKDAVSLKQAHYLQKRIFEGANLHETVVPMMNLCEEVKVFVGNIPKRRTTKKVREPKWNRVYTEREQYEEAKVSEEKVGDIRVILDVRPGLILDEVRCAIVNELLNRGKNEWHPRSNIVSVLVSEYNTFRNDNQVRGHMKSLFQDHSRLTDDIHHTGLIMKKENDRLYFRLN